jgi:hypothetical protein
MPTVKLRRAFPAALMAVSVTAFGAACTASGDSGDPEGGGATPPQTASSAPPLPSGSSPVAVPSTGSGTPGTSAGSGPGPATGSTSAGEVRVVYFSSSARSVTGLHDVVSDQGDLDRFAARAVPADAGAAAAIRASGKAADFSRSVLVGWTAVTGCSQATSAALVVSGDRLVVGVQQPKPLPECFAPFRVTVLFAVPRERMPARPVFG